MNKIAWWRTSVGYEELDLIKMAIEGEHLSQGPIVAEFEMKLAEALDIPFVVLTTSGSVALMLAMMALDIGPGDEVIVPDRTWIATAHGPLMVGATVVPVDVNADLPSMNIGEIIKKISPRTKAIMPVHLSGRSENMEALQEIALKFNLKIVEDAAQAMFSKNKNGYLGTQSDIGCFSLGVAKLITIGQGGFLATRNKAIYDKLILIRNHGLLNNFAPTFFQVGCNFRSTDILAAMGLAQLEKGLMRVKKLTMIYQAYAEGLRDLPFLRLLPVNIARGEVPLYVEALSNERDNLVKFLAEREIETRPFLPNVHDAPYIASDKNFLNSENFKRDGITLPSGPDQSLENISRVIHELHQYKSNHLQN